MSANRVEAFLEAEEQATSLVTELQRLKMEMGSYQDAQITLDKAIDQIEPLLEQMTIAGETLAVLSKTLRENGTPELIARTEAIEQRITQLGSETSSAQESHQKRIVEEFRSDMAQLKEETSALQETHFGRMDNKLESEIARTISEIVSAQNQRDEAMTESNQHVLDELRSLQAWTTRGFAVIAVMLLLLFALVMFT
jgi:hypothetical protein